MATISVSTFFAPAAAQPLLGVCACISSNTRSCGPSPRSLLDCRCNACASCATPQRSLSAFSATGDDGVQTPGYRYAWGRARHRRPVVALPVDMLHANLGEAAEQGDDLVVQGGRDPRLCLRASRHAAAGRSSPSTTSLSMKQARARRDVGRG
ncbi:hypothetical protein OsI_11168 [Oryza sativa Indica Group]|uniref:Uncharacterized protein n=1 Tax=Oryza sativa subsp. indica TaxID=39946 RepID=B8AM15_ORYSI|nr:hypothetical protein OsI_11168 [Oryza sativa Indica Group]